MRLVDTMSEALVLPDLRATRKDEVLLEVVDHMSKVRPEVDRDATLRVLLEREKLGSTGVGHGFAIPHGKLPRLTQIVACFARSAKGVVFGSLDGQPAHLFLTLLAPQGSAGLHLKALARASRLFKNDAFRAKLLAEGERAVLWRLICEQDDRLAHDDG